MRKLTTQIRSSMKTEEDIIFTNILELEYPAAVLDETMRVYPPVPGDMPRISPPGGAMVCGQWVPAGVSSRMGEF
jgi:cytochrome P450